MNKVLSYVSYDSVARVSVCFDDLINAGRVCYLYDECRQLLIRLSVLPCPFHTYWQADTSLYLVGLLVLITAKLR
jgi:hypothetical protein